MTESDLALFVAQLLSLWAAGFAAGYVLTRFRDAVNMTV